LCLVLLCYNISNNLEGIQLGQKEENNYGSLLVEFNKLRNENELKKQLGVHDYSLINALLNKNREVELHSNFIHSMINPNSNHYCDGIFLEFFLKSINEDKFLNLSNSKVHKEKGKIDLLIEDGERVIIIENKLRAVDQPQQISRYIDYSIKNYLNNDNTFLEHKVHVIYLSEYKPTPSKDSTIGFKGLHSDSKELIWENNIVIFNDNNTLSLPKDTRLSYKRVKHSKHLLKWIESSKEWLKTYKPNLASRSLEYAFDEYALILRRLDTKKGWKNLMSLDEYTLSLQEKEEKDMYAFMCEASEKLNNYLSQKLFEEIEFLFPETEREIVTIHEEFDLFSQEKCRNWFLQKGNSDKYRDIGFKVKNKESVFIFAFGINNIAFGEVKNESEFNWKNFIKLNRQNLQKNQKDKNLFTLIEDLNKYKLKHGI